MSTADVLLLDAVGQAELLFRGELAPEELTRMAIERIERVDPSINAVIWRRAERAIADVKDRMSPRPRLFGVPMLLKDAICHSAGDPFHCGMRVLKEVGWVEPADTHLAARFRTAGLIFLGKTNTPELAGATTTEPLAYGPTRNPFGLQRSAGGSSGGSAAAVAAGMVPVAHGNDIGGSIRIPASACGVVGLKPSRGRVSLGPEISEYMGPLTHEHVLTRSVRDSALVLDLSCGYEPGDLFAAPGPTRSFLAAAARVPDPVRIGVLKRGAGDRQIAEVCAAAVLETTRLLEACGHEVVEIECPPLWERPRSGIVGAVYRRFEVERWGRRIGRPIALDEVEPLTALWAQRGASITAAEYVAALEMSAKWARLVVRTWRAQCDLLLTPTCPDLPRPIGEIAPTAMPPADLEKTMAQDIVFTAPFNVTGEPAMSLPVHWTPAGLPVGVQLIAPFGQEELLISVAAQLERAAPWHHHYRRIWDSFG